MKIEIFCFRRSGKLTSTVLYCTVLYCTVLYCTVLYCTVLYCTVVYCSLLLCCVKELCTALSPSYSVKCDIMQCHDKDSERNGRNKVDEATGDKPRYKRRWSLEKSSKAIILQLPANCLNQAPARLQNTKLVS